MANESATATNKKQLTKEDARKTILDDFLLANVSREASLLGRKEVLTGKAKFGIFGDGKEVPQLAMAKVFQNGDFRSGYYRDQTFMMAIGQLTVQEFFAQLYAHTSVEAEPASAGRSMNGHFATRNLNDDGSWKNLMDQPNVSADISPTAGQMPRLLGLAQASKVYRNHEGLNNHENFSHKGQEIAFGTIGDSSTSEGLFWETINAAGVLQVPMIISVWDDGHGISVPKKYQTTKESISEVLKGFQRSGKSNGFEIFKVLGWDYVALIETYEKAVKIAREEHVPVLIHVEELTQPQGHSTSGSHERYKSKERLQWEADFDCIQKMAEWMIDKKIATEEELDEIRKEAKEYVKQEKKKAWEAFLNPIKVEKESVKNLIMNMMGGSSHQAELNTLLKELNSNNEPTRKDVMSAARRALQITRNERSSGRSDLLNWINTNNALNKDRYNSHLYSKSDHSPLNVSIVPPEFPDSGEEVDGRIIVKENFDKLLEQYPEILIFGEDAGKIGGVNQGLEGLQEKYGVLRVSDTGIREATIVGQGIGMAMRGLRPIAEIQYLDYLMYALQIMSDDLATIQYRTKGGQKAPLIVRTRGHRLEGIWHSGSPMGVIVHALRGIHVCVPRNFTDAAGFYNTLIQGDDPAVVVEPLNGYRTKELKPSNLGSYTIPLGVPEIVESGSDITIVSYGSTFNLVLKAAEHLATVGISAELIDVRTLLPFDINHIIAGSLQKTNRILVVDEDVPGGASAYIMQNILQQQKGYFHLDSEPVTLSAKAHRPAYGTDGDYFSKPSIEDIFDAAYNIMHEANPGKFPAIYED